VPAANRFYGAAGSLVVTGHLHVRRPFALSLRRKITSVTSILLFEILKLA
jgi:hypothetical protein